MMPRPVYAALVACFVAFPATAKSEPTNFDECILETMKGVSSDVAARAIIDSCRRLFPDADEGMPAAVVAPAAVAAPAAASQASPTQETPAPAAAPQSPQATDAVMPAAVATVPQSVEPVPQSTGSVRVLTDDELDHLDYRGNFFGTTYRVKVFNGNEELSLTEVTIAVWDKNYIDGLETYRSAVDIAPMEEGTAKYTIVYEGQEETWAWKVVGANGAE